MSHQVIDKRGQEKPSDKIVPLPTAAPAIVKANADGSIQQETTDPKTLVLSPFPDGTCLKMVRREWNGATPKPAGYDQHILVNVVGDQMAITKNETIAHLICDAVNMLFSAQQQMQAETASLVNTIAPKVAPTKDIVGTQH